MSLDGDRCHRPEGFTLVEMVVALGILAILVVLMGQVINQVSKTITRAQGHSQCDTEAAVVFDRIGDDIAQIINRSDADALFIGFPTNSASGSNGLSSAGTDHNDQMFFYSQGSGYATNTTNQSPICFISYVVTNQVLKRLGVAQSWDDQTFITSGNKQTLINGTNPLTLGLSTTNYYHVLGPSVIRMEVALLMVAGTTNADGSSNGDNAYANLTNGTNYWHGLTNVNSIAVGLAILDQTTRGLLTSQQLSNVASALPDSIASNNGGFPGAWTNQVISVPGSPNSQVRIYKRVFPVTR